MENVKPFDLRATHKAEVQGTASPAGAGGALAHSFSSKPTVEVVFLPIIEKSILLLFMTEVSFGEDIS
jgi:hypothetical protein